MTTYNLAAGNNTFTASTTAATNVITGSTGADTFNFGLNATNAAQVFTNADTVLGGAGSDTINFTGNLDFNVTLDPAAGALAFTGIENVVFANTSTPVTFITDDATLADGETMTVDGSSGSTAAAIMTFTSGEAAAGTGAVNFIGGSAADVLTGGVGADTITGNAGNDVITGGAGADNIDGGDGLDAITLGAGADIINFGQVEASLDTVSDFVHGLGGDIIDVGSAGNTALGALVAQVADGTTAAVAHADNTILFLSAATRAAYDTQAEITAAFGAGAEFAACLAADENTLFISAADTGDTYVWKIVESADANVTLLAADEVLLIGILTGISAAEAALMVAGNFQA